MFKAIGELQLQLYENTSRHFNCDLCACHDRKRQRERETQRGRQVYRIINQDLVSMTSAERTVLCFPNYANAWNAVN